MPPQKLKMHTPKHRSKARRGTYASATHKAATRPRLACHGWILMAWRLLHSPNKRGVCRLAVAKKRGNVPSAHGGEGVKGALCRVRCGGLRCHRVALPFVPFAGLTVCFQPPVNQRGLALARYASNSHQSHRLFIIVACAYVWFNVLNGSSPICISMEKVSASP